jgi:hypothetical protein
LTPSAQGAGGHKGGTGALWYALQNRPGAITEARAEIQLLIDDGIIGMRLLTITKFPRRAADKHLSVHTGSNHT